MAERPTGNAQESDTGPLDEEKANGEAQSPVESANGANHEANGAKSPDQPMDEAGESADKETAMSEGESPEHDGKDVKLKSEAEEEEEGAEGSKVDTC